MTWFRRITCSDLSIKLLTGHSYMILLKISILQIWAGPAWILSLSLKSPSFSICTESVACDRLSRKLKSTLHTDGSWAWNLTSPSRTSQHLERTIQGVSKTQISLSRYSNVSLKIATALSLLILLLYL